MRTDRQNYLERIEWESFASEFRIQKFTKFGILPTTTEKIIIWRDESYRLCANALGIQAMREEIIGASNKPGKIVPNFEIEGIQDYEIQCKLQKCFLGKSSKKQNLQGTWSFDIEFSPSYIKRTFQNQKDVSWLTEWFLNGPSESLLYPRTTRRILNEMFQRERIEIDTDPVPYTGIGYEQFNYDFALIQYNPTRRFIIHSVPNTLGPSWSNNLGIEYRTEWGGIPDIDERKAIAEIVGFAFGRRLFNVGYTSFDENGYPVEQFGLNPLGDRDVRNSCIPGQFMPINSTGYQAWGRIESVLSTIIPKYLELREPLHLNHVLWLYWQASQLPLGANLPILSAGLESLAGSWLKSNRSASRGVYLDDKAFKSLLHEELESIYRKLNTLEHKQKVLDSIRRSNQMGANERIRTFFTEIKLPIGQIEKDALRARNPEAHGSFIEYTNENVLKHIQKTDAFFTLFNRAMLKILEYQGNYIDRSTIGHPERTLDEPMGGI